MSREIVPGRVAETAVDPMFVERWSARAFNDEPVEEADLWAMVEAARWAPSSRNEQPWLFIYARTPEDRARFVDALEEENQEWVRRAPVVLFLLAPKTFPSGRPNRWSWFDAGGAWMSFAFQAFKLGYNTHALAGFDNEKAREAVGLTTDDYDVVIGIALGRRGDPSMLSEFNQGRENPKSRKPLADLAREGRF